MTALSGCQYVRVVIAGASKVLAWGANANGALGDGKGESYEVGMNQFSYTPVEVLLPEKHNIRAAVVGPAIRRFSPAKVCSMDGVPNRWGQMGNFVDDSNLTFENTPIMMVCPHLPSRVNTHSMPRTSHLSCRRRVDKDDRGMGHRSVAEIMLPAIGANSASHP